MVVLGFVLFTGFSYGTQNFSNMKYTQVVEYEQVLRSNYENAKDEDAKKAAYNTLIDFQNKKEEYLDKLKKQGLTALINGRDWGSKGKAFNEADKATATTNIAEVISHEHEDANGNPIARSIRNADELGSALDAINTDTRHHSETVSGIVTTQGYKAQHADSRMVRGNGQAEKK